MIIVDAHCDTATEILDHQEDIFSNNGHADLSRMLGKDGWVQFFAAFAYPAVYQAREICRVLQVIDSLYEYEKKYSNYMAVCRNHAEILKAVDERKVAAILSIEGGDCLHGGISTLRMLYRLGVRSLCLTWNYRNEIGDGVRDGSTGGGLTPFGREVVSEMNLLGMLVDVSHLSDRGFWDVISLTGSPIIASHSNARSVCSHPRNLEDSQITAMKENRGVIGINLYPDFLKNDGAKNPENVTVDDVVKHIEHIVSLAGEDHIGLGADFDGIECTPADIKGIQDIDVLFERLLSLNYSEDFLRKLAGENFLRVIKEVLI